jgi:hypothetical protein
VFASLKHDALGTNAIEWAELDIEGVCWIVVFCCMHCVAAVVSVDICVLFVSASLVASGCALFWLLQCIGFHAIASRPLL